MKYGFIYLLFFLTLQSELDNSCWCEEEKLSWTAIASYLARSNNILRVHWESLNVHIYISNKNKLWQSLNIERMLSLRAPWVMNWRVQVGRRGSCEADAKVITSNIFILRRKFLCHEYMSYMKHCYSMLSVLFVYFAFSTCKSGLCCLYHREIFTQGQFIDVRRSRFTPLINSSLFYSVCTFWSSVSAFEL